MNLQSKTVYRGILCATLAVLFAAVACLWVPITSGQGRGRGGEGAQVSNRDWTQDMQMKIMEPFSLASVGDLIVMRPASQFDDPGFQAALKIVRDADMGFGNLEGNLNDERHFDGPLGGFSGAAEVAADIKAMGFKMVNRANNHLFDMNEEGMYATNELLEKAGVVYAGAGRNLDDARAARFLELAKGRVGLVAMHTPSDPARLGATYRLGNTGGKPGLNVLALTKLITVTPEQLDALKKIRDSIYAHRSDYSNPVEAPTDRDGQLELFGQLYKAGTNTGADTYAMNPGDFRDILRSIKNGKEYSDFMIATIHTHQGDSELQRYHLGDHPPDFLVTLAHAAIDNGADAFVGHGVHTLRGMEIYKGKPIFYGLGEFFREMDWSDATYAGISNSPLTPAEIEVNGEAATNDDVPIKYESVIAVSKFDKGKLLEVRLYPIESRHSAVISQRGIPRMAPPDVAQRILARLQMLSQPFGTKIAIEGNIGVIRPPANTVDVGQNQAPQ